MQVVGHFNMYINADDFMDAHGLEEGGKAQMWLDQEVIRLMKPYTPNLNGVLIDSATRNTVIGSGRIIQRTPYARYLYYGKLFVDPITLKGAFYNPKTGRFWSRPGVAKIPDPSGRELNYNTVKSPLAGKMWFERMKQDKKDILMEGLKKVIK